LIKALGIIIGVPLGIILPIVFIAIGLMIIFEIEQFIKNNLRGLMFPYPDMSDDDLEGLPFVSRDMSHAPGEEDEHCNLSNRHLFVHGSKGGKKINGRDGLCDAVQPLLLPANKEEIIVPDPVTGKPREPTEVEVVDIEIKEKVEEPKEILVDLNK